MGDNISFEPAVTKSVVPCVSLGSGTTSVYPLEKQKPGEWKGMVSAKVEVTKF